MLGKKRIEISIAVLVGLFITATVQADQIYVDITATNGLQNGSDWFNAYTDLEDALEHARNNISITEIWVAQGEYFPSEAPFEALSNPRNPTFMLVSGVAVYGGFSGTEILREERNIEGNPTILSGDIGIKDDNSDNAIHVVTCDTNGLTLDGFIVKLGNATIPNPNELVDRGAGLFIKSGEINVSNCTFTENQAINLGGAVYNQGIASFTSCLFTLNVSEYDGGAIYNEASISVFTDCLISNNHATNQSGGAIYNHLSDVSFYDCTLSENTANTTGGALSNESSELSIESTRIIANGSGASGGGIYNLSSQSVLVNCFLANNSTLGPIGSGGALADNGDSYSTLTNCTLTGNEASRSGGGGGIHFNASDGTITNCVFWNNSDGNGSNFDESAQIRKAPSRTLEISHSCVQGCNTFCTGVYAGSHNTSGDPLLIPGLPYLGDGSSAINAGNNNADIDATTPETDPLPLTDLIGNPRVVAGTVDMGAYERQDICSNGTPCDDGNACTINDVCSNGICQGVPVVCDPLNECSTRSCDPNGAEGNCDTITPINEGGDCDDQNPCSTNGICSNGACISTPVTCQPPDQCHVATCDPIGTNGNCDIINIVENGEPCNDDNACTINDACWDGSCQGNTFTCNPPDDCNSASCDPTGAEGNCDTITPDNEGGTCNDDNPCTNNDICSNGHCVGKSFTCEPPNDCNIATCDPMGADGNCDMIDWAENGKDCDDDDPCTIDEECFKGDCVGFPIICDPPNECSAAACDPEGEEGNCGNITPDNEGETCDDGDVCTIDDTCSNGFCVGNPVVCPDPDTCNIASCDPVGTNGNCTIIEPANEGGPCDDEDACTINDVCSNGNCRGVSFECEPPDVCNLAFCDPTGTNGNCDNLIPTNENGSCDDGNPCTIDDICSNGTCKGVSVVCDQPYTCNIVSCDPVGTNGNCDVITPANDGGSCDDSDPCTIDDVCSNGTCEGISFACNQPDVCNIASCDPIGTNGNCDAITPTNNGGACDDGDPCTVDDMCSNGTCKGIPIICDQPDACNIASCNPVGTNGNCDIITPTNEGGTCDDNNPCTVNDACSNGICAGTPVDCSIHDGKCHTTSCDPLGANGNCDVITPANDGDICDDDNPCTENDVCSSGLCAGIQFECPDPDPCNIAFCDPAGTNGNCDEIIPAHNGEPCDDADICTVDDACNDNGTCVGIIYDIDSDGVSDICDNCPTVYNPEQGDDCDVPPNILCVKFNAIGANDGSSWYDAFNRLQDALTVAQASGGVITEIWVAAGPWSYKPTDDTNRRATFQLISGVGVYGGFAGTEQSRGQRDMKSNVTILSGDIGIPGDHSDNCYHVVTGTGADETAVLENFLITRGHANGTHSAELDMGGGLFYFGSSYDQSGPSVINCVFLANHAHESGGGVWTKTSPYKGVTLTNCVFLDNTTDGNGAGVSNPIGAIEVTNCTFLNNTAGDFGGGLYTGVSTAQGCPANSVITNSIFWNNHDQSGSDQQAQVYAINTGCSAEKRLPDRSAKPDPAAVYNCCIQGWTEETWLYTGDYDLVMEKSNFADNPMFANSCGIDEICGTTDDDYRLTFGSPCLDSGSNGFIPQDISDLNSNGSTTEPTPYDLIGNKRIVHEVVDIGAIEFKYDCNSNGIEDFQDIELGTSEDCNTNTIPDECETDCNFNGVPDDCDLAAHTSEDCNSNGVPDECDIAYGTSTDCNTNGIPDSCDIISGVIGSGWICLSDPCAVVTDEFADCNSNSIPDECELGERFFILENGDITAASRLLEFNLVTGASKVIINLPIGGNDRGLTVLPEQNDLLVTDFENLLIYRINSNNGDIISVTDISSGELPILELAYDRHQNTLYGSAKHHGLHEINLDSGTVTHIMDLPYSLPTMDEWVCLAYDGFTRQLIGADREEQIPYFVNPTTQTYTALPNNLNVGVMSDLAIDSASGLIYGTNQTGQIFRVDRATGETTYVVTVHNVGFTVGIAAAFRTAVDCNANSVPDECDIAASTSSDCNTNGFPDECDVLAGTANDVNSNGMPDECELDCNSNGIPDDIDIIFGTTHDCNDNLLDDNCEPDCNNTSVPDDCDVLAGTSEDCNDNLIPDECETDCNSNGVPDDCDITYATSVDCNTNSVPDECDLAGATSADCNSNNVPDECDISGFTSTDCNANTVPDDCEIASGSSADCNSNSIPDECDINEATSGDCNTNSIPDECDIAAGFSRDCNTNGIPDSCDLSGGTSLDCNATGIPDSCEPMGNGDYDGNGQVSIDDYPWLADCLAGPDSLPAPLSPDCVDACFTVFDFDSDGDVDLEDFAEFQRRLN